MSTWTSSSRREIEESFLGLAFKLHPQPEDKHAERELGYAMVVHDGTGVVGSENFTAKVLTAGKSENGLKEEVKRVSREVLARVRQYEEDRHVKVSSMRRMDVDDRFAWSLWLSLFPRS